jgi:hypothetical protein
VTISLGTGMTTMAFFQKASLVGWASGSEAMSFRIWASVRRRSLFQSVAAWVFLASLGLEVLPVAAALVRLGAPGRDDAPFVILFVFVGIFVGIDNCNFQAVHNPDGIDARLAVVEAVVDLLKSRAVEDSCRVGKRYAVEREVAAVLCFIPSVAHALYLHNVNIENLTSPVDFDGLIAVPLHPGRSVSLLRSRLGTSDAALGRRSWTVGRLVVCLKAYPDTNLLGVQGGGKGARSKRTPESKSPRT